MKLKTSINTYLDLRNDYGEIENQQILICAKCISGDNSILTPKNKIKIRNIPLNSKFKIMSYNFEKDIIEEDFAIRIDSGKKEIFEIKTESGKSIRASKDHIFFVKTKEGIKEIPLSELKEGDSIFCYEN